LTSQRFIITGKQGSGKTTLCLTIIEIALQSGWDVSGIVSPAVFDKSEKTGIDVIDLKTKEQRRLAYTRHHDKIFGPKTIKWSFDQKVLTWVTSVLNRSTPCDLLVIDEIGPLEFNQSEGWVNGFDVLGRKDYKIAIIVIRSSLLSMAFEHWPDAKVIEVLNDRSV
jgi:nucleoside-triphosphatase THEP1